MIYEMHVRGYTKLHPGVSKSSRDVPRPDRAGGDRSYRRLGVTAVELLPVHGFVDDSHLLDKGLINYWGYNTISFFAPDPRYA